VKTNLVPLSTAAKITTLSESRIRQLCAEGKVPGAVQPGGKRGQWKVPREEMQKRVTPRK
jgi:hypothetical protein